MKVEKKEKLNPQNNLSVMYIKIAHTQKIPRIRKQNCGWKGEKIRKKKQKKKKAI